MNVNEIIGMPIVTVGEKKKLGNVTSIVIDHDLKSIQKLRLSRDKFIIIDDIVRFADQGLLVKNANVVQEQTAAAPQKGDGKACVDEACLIPQIKEAASHHWWLQISNWD